MEYDYAAIGDLLKKRRLELRRELKEISEEIKIAERYLAAIEEAKVDELPSLVYFGLFVRTYATELGIDPEQMLEDSILPSEGYSPDDQTNSVRNSYPEKKEPQKTAPPARTIVWLGGVLIIVIAIIVLVSFPGDGNREPGNARVIEEVGEVSAREAPETDSVDTVALNQESVQPMKLDISITETSWLLVMADGDTVLNRNLEEGATRALEANDAFVISVGNPDGVQLRLDDTPLRPLSPTGRPVRDLEISQTNKEQFYLIPEDQSIGGN